MTVGTETRARRNKTPGWVVGVGSVYESVYEPRKRMVVWGWGLRTMALPASSHVTDSEGRLLPRWALQLGSRLDAVVSRLETQAKMQLINKNMAGIVKSLEKALTSNNLEQVKVTSASPRLTERCSAGVGDHGVEVALWGPERSFTSVLEPSPVRAPLLSAVEAFCVTRRSSHRCVALGAHDRLPPRWTASRSSLRTWTSRRSS